MLVFRTWERPQATKEYHRRNREAGFPLAEFVTRKARIMDDLAIDAAAAEVMQK